MSRPPKEKNVKKATDEVVPAHSAASKGRRRWSHAASQPEGGREGESKKVSNIENERKGRGEKKFPNPLCSLRARPPFLIHSFHAVADLEDRSQVFPTSFAETRKCTRAQPLRTLETSPQTRGRQNLFSVSLAGQVGRMLQELFPSYA